MNLDVLSVVASYCDIDSRRALLQKPNRLCRNPEFDTKMQGLHRAIDRRTRRVLNLDYGLSVIHRRQDTSPWLTQYHTVLNSIHTVNVLSDGAVTHIVKEPLHPALFGESITTFYPDGTIRSHVMLEFPVQGAFFMQERWVATYFRNGQWQVVHTGTFTEKDEANLTRLGFVLYCPTDEKDEATPTELALVLYRPTGETAGADLVNDPEPKAAPADYGVAALVMAAIGLLATAAAILLPSYMAI
jgi:hypothetical protein